MQKVRIGTVTYLVDDDIAEQLREALLGQEQMLRQGKGSSGVIGPATLIYTLIMNKSPGPREILAHRNGQVRDFRRENVYPTTKAQVMHRCRALAREHYPATRPNGRAADGNRQNMGGIYKVERQWSMAHRLRLTIHGKRKDYGTFSTQEEAIRKRDAILSNLK